MRAFVPLVGIMIAMCVGAPFGAQSAAQARRASQKQVSGVSLVFVGVSGYAYVTEGLAETVTRLRATFIAESGVASVPQRDAADVTVLLLGQGVGAGSLSEVALAARGSDPALVWPKEIPVHDQDVWIAATIASASARQVLVAVAPIQFGPLATFDPGTPWIEGTNRLADGVRTWIAAHVH